jgi:hypothetical protein
LEGLVFGARLNLGDFLDGESKPSVGIFAQMCHLHLRARGERSTRVSAGGEVQLSVRDEPLPEVGLYEDAEVLDPGDCTGDDLRFLRAATAGGGGTLRRAHGQLDSWAIFGARSGVLYGQHFHLYRLTDRDNVGDLVHAPLSKL